MADARNRQNVIVGAPNIKASGGLLMGPVVKEGLPTDATSELNAATLKLKPAGFIAQDGITKTVDRSTEKIKDWANDTIIVVETDHTVTVKFSFYEAINTAVLEAVFGKDNVTVSDTSVAVADAAGETPHQTFIAEMNGGEGKKARVVIPDGQITSVGDIVYKKDEPVRYEVEIECFADKNGKKFYAYYEKPAADAA
ncbi:phage tail tube protein [Corynebacterium renale]|uniref:phage tail tube protein n=1 Tax=Corynebacterium renale TaxID=1724 RepID=UPI000E0235D7|nr:hypothetical protein [Corynebacterium renale]STC97541.1 structural phage protein [Corynebacterium renale]